jgi:hypothetical protein
MRGLTSANGPTGTTPVGPSLSHRPVCPAGSRTVAAMGVLGEMFPGRKIRDESTEAGSGQEHWQLGPIDLDNRTVQVQRVVEDAEPGAEEQG